MELVTWSLLGLTLIVSTLLLVNWASARGKLPPGPRGLPLIGCPWAMLKELHVVLTETANDYGHITSMNILGKTIVSLNTAEVTREAFNTQAFGEIFSARGIAPDTNEWTLEQTAFLPPGPRLSKQRKLVHKLLNHYGEGVHEAEKAILGELTHVVDYLEKSEESIDMDEIIYNSLINIITILLKGHRYDYDSSALGNVRVMEETGVQSSSPANTFLFSIMPFLKHIPIGPGKLVIECVKAVKQFQADYCGESKATYKPHVTRGMIDSLINHQRESRLEDGSTWLEEKSLEAIALEMIAAGVMTTRGALYGFFLIIGHHPEVATKIQNEIEAAVERSRFPKLDDRSQMPYTMAAMFELMRYISHVPVGLPHSTTDDVTFHGYFIPKHATVISNTWCFHHDEKTWPEPWTFRPERFLDLDGKLVAADHPTRKHTIPFGIGRRSCVGEAFAKSRMFLFITTLLQRFNFTADPARPLRSCDPRTYRPGLVLSPFPYWLKVTSRA